MVFFHQLSLLDSNMLNMTYYKPFTTAPVGDDVCLLGLDPSENKAWIGYADNQTNIVSVNYPGGLGVANYIAPSSLGFVEASIPYSTASANGFNGMAVSLNWLYVYNGDSLKKMDKATGAIVSRIQVSTTAMNWGGLSVDMCDNIYVGNNSSIQIYNSALALTSTIPLSNTVYDVVLGANDDIVYACGNGFVSSISLSTPPSITITHTTTPESCAGCDGTATPTLLICGSAPASTPTYAWSAGGQTTQTATNLCAGTYTVTITLNCAQVFTDTVTITSSGTGGSLTVNTTVNNVKCFADNTGSISLAISGGTGPYTYSWTPSISTGSSATGLTSGTYTCSINDAACSSKIEVITITEPSSALTVSTPVITDPTCGSTNGIIVVSASGGTGSMSYSWSNAVTGNTNNNLAPGIYSLTVTDANACTQTKNITLSSNPGPPISSLVPTSVLCKGNATGSAVVTATGTGIITYTWSTASTAQTVNNLAAGNYTVTVKDGSGCINIGTIAITEPAAAVSISGITASNMGCASNNGVATATATGGSGSLTYSWSNTATGATASNLSSGVYTVTESV